MKRKATGRVLRELARISANSRKAALIFYLLSAISSAHAATVTGTIQNATGTGYAARLSFVPLSNPQVLTTNLLSGQVINKTCAANGTFTITLQQGDYRIQIDNADRFLISVPNNTNTYQLTALITQTLLYQFKFPYLPMDLNGYTNSITNLLTLSASNGIFSLSLRIPRLTQTQRDAYTATNGLVILNTTSGALNFYDGTNWVALGTGAGSVTSVGLTVPSWLSVSGSPVTTTGSFVVTAAGGQTANQVLATPDGTAGGLAPRALVAADIPSLDAAKIGSGTIAAARMPALTGDVTTSAGAVATTIANDSVTYAKLQNVSATQRALGRNTAGSGDAEEITGSQLLDWIGSTRGSVLYRGASGWAILSPGTAGYPLTSGGAGADPSYSAPSFVGIYRDQAIEAGAMFAGPTAATTGTYTNTVNDTLSDSWTFADAATQSTRFSLTFPDVWDVGIVKLKLYVVCDSTNSSGITNLVWGAKAGSLAPGEAATNAIFGTQVFVTNGLATSGQVMQVFTSPAITVSGSPAVGDSIWFDISRQGSNASDTWTNTPVRLLKARVQWLESSTAPASW